MKPIIFAPPEFPQVMRRLQYAVGVMNPKKKYRLEVKEHREKRSLDANAYFWVLADKLATAMGITKEEVYRNAIKEIGGVSSTGCFQNEDADELCRLWALKGLGWLTETFPSKLADCTNIVFYKGSSEYDTSQMSRLIDNIVQDCKALEIETETPERLAMMKEAWDEKSNRARR